MNAIASSLASDLDAEFPSNVVPLKPASPEEEVERLAAVHRKAEGRYRQRAAETRRAMKLAEAQFKSDEKTEIARHKAAMELIAERRANNKELGERDIAADERLANYNRNAVADLTGE